MARVFITGSADGLGLMVGRFLADQGHRAVLHARNDARAADAKKAMPKAEAVVVGDLATIAAAKDVAKQVNALGAFDVRNRDHFTFLRFLGAAMEPKDGANEKAPQRASRSVERKGGDNRGVRRKFQAAKAKTRSAP